jgi:hypothetical protein
VADVTMKAWLDGHPFDLQDLADLLANGPVRVVRDSDSDHERYYLTAPEIDDPPNGIPFYDAARLLLSKVNGLGRTNKSDFRPVTLSGRYSDAAGEHLIVTPAAAEARARLTATVVVTGADGQPLPEPPSPWPGRFAVAATCPEVAEVLDMMGRVEPLGWVELYKIHEIIRDAIRPDKIVGRGWTDTGSDSAFTASANLPGVSGSEARHARMQGTPKRTMSLAEGRSFVGELVTKWLDSQLNP